MFSRSAYRRVLRYLPHYRGALIGGAACVVASRLLMVYGPRLLGEAVNHLDAGGADAAALAKIAGIEFLVVAVVSGALTFLMRWLLVGASRGVERDLKRDLFDHIEHLPAKYFDRTRTGDLISRLTSDVEAVRFSAGPGVMYLGSTLVLFPMAIVSMWSLSGRVALLALVPLLAIMGLVRVLAPGVMRRTRAVQDRLGDLSARAQESFAGARVVRAYATETVELDAFREANNALVEETLGLAKYRALLIGGLFSLGGLAELAVFWYGGRLVTSGELELGYLVSFQAYVTMLIWPMISVGWVVSALQRSAAAIQRIDEVMDTPREMDVLGKAAAVPDAFDGRIDVHDLTFQYEGSDQPALENVSFSVPRGGTLALVGPVGSGKSTLLALLTRTYEPPKGTVHLDGFDVTSIPLEKLRSAFATVSQDAFLFSDTIQANLSYAIDEALTPARAHEVAKLAGLDGDIAAFPRGFETVVGERGLTLSGGQKQRTTLARALLVNAPVLLLDDCLSAVDTHTEARILEKLVVEMRRRTSIVVAHRLSTVRHADHIVVLEAGRIIEAGSHEELVKGEGWYARTDAQQRLQAELEDLA